MLGVMLAACRVRSSTHLRPWFAEHALISCVTVVDMQHAAAGLFAMVDTQSMCCAAPGALSDWSPLQATFASNLYMLILCLDACTSANNALVFFGVYIHRMAGKSNLILDSMAEPIVQSSGLLYTASCGHQRRSIHQTRLGHGVAKHHGRLYRTARKHTRPNARRKVDSA